jgi:asparagine synthase (glutamine-hydrolysing)
LPFPNKRSLSWWSRETKLIVAGMCGISGIALSSQRSGDVNEAVLVRMRDVLQHRGPDDAGIFIEGPIGLAHRRLSIVDLATGHQPMSNEDGSIKIVFNGEIYNHAEHRPILKARGHVYASNSDTETILHLYEEHGDRCVEHLRGMFAFAIWDRRKRELLLARDRLGIKPLYYFCADDGSLYFGSEIKAILASGAIAPEVNFSVLPDYLANYAPSGEETLFRRIKRLPAGHTLTWGNGKHQIRQYWDVRFEPDDRVQGLSEQQYIGQWRDKFHDAVRVHLMSDVPLGVFLSGGIDSSAIAAMMSRLVKGRFKTFSVAFPEREANELEFARIVSRAYGTDHYEVVVSPEEYFASLPQMIWQEDEPIAHVASIPLYHVSKLAARHVKVVLTGEGSDELLAGYGKYRTTVYNLAFGGLYHGWTAEGFRSLVRAGLSGVLPPKFARKLQQTFLWRGVSVEQLYFDNFAVFPRSMQEELLTPEVISRIGTLDPYQTHRQFINTTDARTILNQLLYVDLRSYLHELLMKQDQMSMAASVESRVPFLDRELVEFTTRLPERMKLRGWTTKYVLREAMKDMLPREILVRPKMGFPVPVGAWFRGKFRHIVDDCILGDRVRERGMLNHRALEHLVGEHNSGRKDHSQRLWSLVNLELWLRQAIDGDAVAELVAGTENTAVQ